MKKKLKICFAASSGGHFEQILMLKSMMEKYDSFLLTEETKYSVKVNNVKICYLKQVNRRERSFLACMLINAVLSFKIYIKEHPNIIICTGVLATVPMCLLVKLFGGKLIYIESFAKVMSPTETGKLMYRFADQFYVQWPTMKEIYPKAIYLGGIY